MKISFRNEGEIKTFSDEGKLREFVTIRPAIKETARESLSDRREIVAEGKPETLGMKEEQQE